MNLKPFISIIIICASITSCQTIKEKSEDLAKKENEMLSQYLGKELTELQIKLGTPTDDFIGENGNNIIIYKTKKYGISCERKFEVNSSGIITGFTSSGCF